jgi:hypothetical protein
MERKRCKGCGRFFSMRANIHQQKYCSDPECQRVRKWRWQANKLREDKDYRDNQHSAQCRWVTENPEYWKKYRETHLEYTTDNRKRQRRRDKKRRQDAAHHVQICTEFLAKMDE